MNIEERLVYYAYKYEGDYNKITRALANKESIRNFECKDKYISILSDVYPEKLKHLKCPPYIIFYKGDISLLKRDAISIVGSREASLYGEKITELIVKRNRDKVIVSGLAKGIDSIAHKFALKYTKTIGVIGSGLKYRYPYENEDLYKIMENENLIISEYPFDTPIRKYNFPQRNRLIAALGSSLYVTQAKIKSGTMTTVYEALELGRDIYVAPYEVFDDRGSGCNLLLSQGANMIINE